MFNFNQKDQALYKIRRSMSESYIISHATKNNFTIVKPSKKDQETLTECIKETTKLAIENILKEILLTPCQKSIVKIIHTPHLALKTFLVLFILVSTGFTSYLVIQSILSYFQYEVTSISRTIYETPTLFPKEAFCNKNPCTTKYAFELYQRTGKCDVTLALDEEKKLTAHDLNDILFFCKFNDDECVSDDFSWSFDHEYGNCYTFNSELKDLKQQALAGPLFGLQLEFYVNYYEKLSNYVYDLGAIIRIVNSSYASSEYSFGNLVSSGFSTYFVVEREFKSILPRPYSNCQIDSSSPKFIQGLDLYNLISQSGYFYTQQFCFYQCYQEFIVRKYNCSSARFLSLFNATNCNHQEINSIMFANDDFSSIFINKNCLSACPLECDQALYKTSVSFSQMSENEYYVQSIKTRPNLTLDFLNRTLNSQTAKESIVRVNIFYESLSYTLATESPKLDGISLLGEIGGNLGLFLGISVFSVCEVIEVAIEIFFILNKRHQNKVKPILKKHF